MTADGCRWLRVADDCVGLLLTASDQAGRLRRGACTSLRTPPLPCLSFTAAISSPALSFTGEPAERREARLCGCLPGRGAVMAHSGWRGRLRRALRERCDGRSERRRCARRESGGRRAERRARPCAGPEPEGAAQVRRGTCGTRERCVERARWPMHMRAPVLLLASCVSLPGRWQDLHCGHGP